MSAPTSAPDARIGASTAVLAAVAWIASVVAANGFLSLGTGLEVVSVAGAGPLAEPVGVVLAAVLIALRGAFSTARSALLPVEHLLVAAVCLIVVPALVAALNGAGTAFLALGAAATSPFTIIDAVLAAAAGLVVLLLARAKAAGAGRPRWPWERDGAD